MGKHAPVLLSMLSILYGLMALVLTFTPRRTHYPDTLADVWDAPYINLVLVEQLEAEEFYGYQYGWPFNAFETWTNLKRPNQEGRAVLIGLIANVLIHCVILGLGYYFLRIARDYSSRRQQG